MQRQEKEREKSEISQLEGKGRVNDEKVVMFRNAYGKQKISVYILSPDFLPNRTWLNRTCRDVSDVDCTISLPEGGKEKTQVGQTERQLRMGQSLSEGRD